MSRKKSYTIYNWKRRGVVSNDFHKLYEKYININNCELCNIEFNDDRKYNSWRCLDHDHKTGLYRQTICNKCNIYFDTKVRKNNKLGYKHLSYFAKRNIYIYRRKINNKYLEKYFKTLKDALCFKFIQILKYG